MAIYLSTQEIQNLYLGNSPLSKLFSGELQIWPTGTPGTTYPDKQISPEPYGPYPTPIDPYTYTPFSGGTSDNIYAIEIAPDGSVYVGGIFTTYDGVSRVNIVKIQPNGDLDTSFTTGTGFNQAVRSITIGPVSGKIYVAGSFSSYNGVTCSRFVALDPSTGTRVNNYTAMTATIGYGLEEDEDGKVMAWGGSGQVRRFNSDGTTDTTFTYTAGTTSPIRTVARFPDGNYFISRQVSSTPFAHITFSDGSIDAVASNNLQITQGFSENYAPGPDGKIYVGTGTMRYGGYSTPIMKVGSDGVFDSTFAQNASKATISQTAKLLPYNGGVITTGTTSQGREVPYFVYSDFHIFDEDGNYMGTDNLYDMSMFIWTGAMKGDNLLTAGTLRQVININFTQAPSGIYEVVPKTTSWSSDSQIYDFQNGFGGTVYAIEKFKNKLLVGGDLTSYNGVNITSNLVMLDTTGGLDYSFSPTNITGKINKIKSILDSNTILVGGQFSGYLKAYNENGSENTNWTTTFDGEVKAIYYNPYKQQVAIGGAFTGGIKILDKFGNPVSSFISGTGFNGRVNGIFWSETNKKLYCVGNFTTYNGTTLNVPKIAIINADGSLYVDTVIGTGFIGEPYCIFPDQYLSRFYIGGAFTEYNGTTCGNFAYVNGSNLQSDAVGSDGPDYCYTRPNQFNGPVHQIGYLNDRSGISTYNTDFVAVGEFTSYRVGEPGYGLKTVGATGFARIGQDYWEIPVWNEGISTNGPVYALASQFTNNLPPSTTYNNWLIGGSFTEVGGVPNSGIAQVGATGYLI